jgi:hypothetical protein
MPVSSLNSFQYSIQIPIRGFSMVNTQLAQRFPHQWDLLQSMYPDHHFTTGRTQRLDKIFRVAEKRWEQNIQRLTGKKVKYLLIGEAPPWTETGEVRYFYSTCDGAWVNRVWKAFFDNQKPTDVSFTDLHRHLNKQCPVVNNGSKLYVSEKCNLESRPRYGQE